MFSRLSCSPVFWTMNISRTIFGYLTVSEQKFSTRNRFEEELVQQFGRLIVDNTVIHRSMMVPEIALRLITPASKLWTASYGEEKLFPSDPFWSIFWPGGQAICRYIFDLGNANFLEGKRVLDIGCGCGAAAIGAVLAGAKKPVVANDVDKVALASVHLNCECNGLQRSDVALSQINYLEGCVQNNAAQIVSNFDVIFVGDLFYDDVIGRKIVKLLEQVAQQKKIVLVGDPGRWFLKEHGNVERKLMRVAKFELTDDVKSENFGFDRASVFRFVI